MKKIKQDELFESLNHFLKGKGIELTNGAYAQGIQRACNLLGDTINATQSKARNARNKVSRKLDQVRQCIHEATAPKPPRVVVPKPMLPRPKKVKKPRTSRKKSSGPAGTKGRN